MNFESLLRVVESAEDHIKNMSMRKANRARRNHGDEAACTRRVIAAAEKTLDDLHRGS